MVEKLKTALSLIFLVALTSCFEMSGSTAPDATTSGATEVSTGLTSAATDSAPGSGEADLNDTSGVGTVVYFPSKPKELNTMTLMLGAVDGIAEEEIETEGLGEETESESEEAETEDDGVDASNAVYSPSCGRLSGYPGTQFCKVTPETYSLSVKGIYLVTCVDDVGAEVICSHENQDVSVRQALYEGDLVALSITSEGVSFPQELTDIASDMAVGGIQFLMGSFSQQFPSSDAEEAAKIAAHLQGKSYRRCTTSNNEGTSAQMESSCGLADAQLGDILFDSDGDAVFGYLDTEKLSPTEVFETAVRPVSYESGGLGRYMENMTGMKKFFMDGAGTSEGFFAPIFALPEIQAVTSGSSYDFKLVFDLEQTLAFIDGARAILSGERRVCVGGVIGECPYDDDDPESVGVYNPYYDALIMTRPPEVSISVEEKVSEAAE